MNIAIRRKLGRCANGAERDGGSIWHAVTLDKWTALCGAKPGRMSAGWGINTGDEVTCKRCRRKLEQTA